MPDSLFDAVEEYSSLLKLDFSAEEFASLAEANNMGHGEILSVEKVFEYLKDKKAQATVDILLRANRLPLKHPKTFDNFDFSRIGGRSVDKLRSICRGSISRTEGKRRTVTDIGLYGLAKILKVSIEELFGAGTFENGA